MAATGTLIEGYDGMKQKELFAKLRLRSQSDLSDIEAYERAHEDRGPVLDKLRYLRTREPVEGYDALDAEEVVAKLEHVDAGTLLRARGYEKKLRRRPEVLEGIDRVRTAGRPSTAAQQDAEAAGETGYQGSLASRLMLNVSAGALMVIVAVMLIAALFVLVIVIMTAVAPNLLN